jgi:hypothetical protein
MDWRWKDWGSLDYERFLIQSEVKDRVDTRLGYIWSKQNFDDKVPNWYENSCQL